MGSFKFLDHVSDVYIEVQAKNLSEAFEEAGKAVFEVMTNIKKITSSEKYDVKIQAEDKEALLFDWLGELIYIFDTRNLIFSKIKVKILNPIKDKLELIGELYGVSKKQKQERASKLLREFGLYERRNQLVRGFSKGMKQKLLLCMALINKPQILFLDEPTSGLDVESQRLIRDMIQEFNKEGMTVFLTTHNMEEANQLCDRIAIINHGKIISQDTPKNLKILTQEYKAIDIYLANGVSKRKIEELRTIREVQEVREGFHVIVEDIHESIFEIIERDN